MGFSTDIFSPLFLKKTVTAGMPLVKPSPRAKQNNQTNMARETSSSSKIKSTQ